jgi:hypothetical protein
VADVNIYWCYHRVLTSLSPNLALDLVS